MPNLTNEQREKIVENVKAMLLENPSDIETDLTPSKPNSTKLYLSLGIFALLLIARVLYNVNIGEMEPINILMFYFALLFPWLLLAVYFFDTYPLATSVPIKIPLIGEYHVPGGTFIAPLLLLVCGVLFGNLEYGYAKEKADTTMNSIGNIEKILKNRISASISLQFFDDWAGIKEKSCNVGDILIIREESIKGCGPTMTLEELATFPNEGELYNSRTSCNGDLKKDLVKVLNGIDLTDEEMRDMERTVKKYSVIDEFNMYHGVMILEKTNNTSGRSSNRSSKVVASVNTVSSVSSNKNERHLLPLFTINNLSLSNRRVHIYMKQLSRLSTFCNLEGA